MVRPEMGVGGGRKTGDVVVMRTCKMKVGGHRKTETEVERCYEKRHEGERSKDRSTRPENVEIENWMRRPQMGKRPKKKNHIAQTKTQSLHNMRGYD